MTAFWLVLVSEGQGDIFIVRVINTCGWVSRKGLENCVELWGGVGMGGDLRNLGSSNPCTEHISGDKR